MSEAKICSVFRDTATRRHIIALGVATVAGLAVRETGSNAQDMTETQSTGPERARTSLHQEVEFKASPNRIYGILLDSKQFASFSGEPAEISREAGGTFSMFGGKIVGRNVELVPNQRIVQAWRPSNWPPGDYTLVKFELKPKGSQTQVILDHTGFHEGDFGHFDPGWRMRYWGPLAKYLG
jgi:activator of HSP90 ATPase